MNCVAEPTTILLCASGSWFVITSGRYSSLRIREMGRCLRWAERNFYEVSHSLSRDTDRRPLDFLSRGRSERCPHSPPAAWSAVFFTNVRAALHEAFRSL